MKTYLFVNKILFNRFFLFCLILLITDNIFAQDVLFYYRNSTNRLYRYELDTGTEVSISLGSATNHNNPDLIFDEVNKKLYWLSQNGGGGNPFLRMVPGDFTASTTVTTLFQVGDNSSSPDFNFEAGDRGLSIDGVNNKVYLGEGYFNNSFAVVHEIVSYDLSDPNPLSTRAVLHSYVGEQVSSTVVDVPNNRLYWAETGNNIGYVELDGNNPTIISTPGNHLFTIRKDPLNERIVYTVGNATPGGIKAVTTDGATTVDLYNTTSTGGGGPNMRPLTILGNGDIYFVEHIFNNSFAITNVNLYKGHVNTSPGSNALFTGITYNSSGSNQDFLYFLEAGTLAAPLSSITITPTSASTDENTGTLTYQFERTGGDMTSTLQVNFSISGTASNSDFSLSGNDSYDTGNNTGKITFGMNQSQVTLTVTPQNDAIIEADETVIVKVEP